MSVVSYFEKWFGTKGLPEAIEKVVSENDPTEYYRHQRTNMSDLWVQELPLFNLWMARFMLCDPVVRIGLQARNAALSAAQITVTSEDADVKEYVEKLHSRIWNRYGTVIRRTKHYGFQGLQFDYEKNEEDGNYYPTDVKHFSPYDTRVLSYRGKAVGFRVNGGGQSGSVAHADVLPPRGVWLTYDTEDDPYYGKAILKHSYGPWYEKWMRHGFKKLTQQRMMKDAYTGEVLWYPPNMNVKRNDGTVVPWRDILRQISENSMAGSTRMLPSLLDDNGNKLVDYERPQDTGSPIGILEWGRNLDTDIWYGLDVFPEIIKSGESGSGFSGRSVPFLLFLSSCNDEHTSLVNGLDASIYRPLVWMAKGPGKEYEIQCVPLAETFVEDIAGSSVGGASMGGSHGDRAYPGTEGQTDGASLQNIKRDTPSGIEQRGGGQKQEGGKAGLPNK